MDGHEHFSCLPSLNWHVAVVSEASDVKLVFCGSEAENRDLLEQLAGIYNCLFLV